MSLKQFLIRPLPTIVFGAGSSENLAAQMQAVGTDTVLVVTDQTLRRAGVLDEALKSLSRAGVRVEVFDGVEANPTDLNVEAGAEIMRTLGSAAVLAFGGGSSMDCGKAIALLGRNRGRVEDLQGSPVLQPGAPVVAVPTTAGTGSETNNACVITNSRLGRKTYVMHPSITPKFAVLDPMLTVGLPPYPTATCGFDVLTHALEAYVSLMSTPYSDAVALEAIRMVIGNLREVVADGSDREARGQMLLASAMAAIAFNVAGLGAAHGTGHALSARLNAAHGQTLATMLPAVMAYNAEVCASKYAHVAQLFGANGAADAAIEAVTQLRDDIGLNHTIRGLGAQDDLLQVLLADAAADPVSRSNPRPIDADSLKALYSAAW